ncbi:MAG TPA: shikimate dehydrogenase [Syntrophales bacterium]|nr:shikimate dehydrogenase [Syntrophales bacterium]HOM07586.1 shikimate dehydrogenase [Syntrophales bacterium]HOO00209.1 shikimate dehydrogenase [Syntrophales bacterium]HPC01576.1 shikimate dehydrogenase [Syntrophales bacterium]HPQ07174.1 shikimate dehydrogenase [Syntrophales bacterium]
MGKAPFGLCGFPLGHSLSPAMHRAAFAALGIEAAYEAYPVAAAAACVATIRERGLRGVSVTMPLKEVIIPYLDEVAGEALAIGAVNTVRNDAGRLVGFNTDWLGIRAGVEERTSMAGAVVAVLGAGGAARAAVFAVRAAGGIPVVVNRDGGRGEALAGAFGCAFVPLGEIGRVEAEGLIHTTPVGMAPNEDASLLGERELGRFRWVMDAVYRPPRTRLLTLADRAGCLVVSGLRMFLHQGAGQIRIWTGLTPPLAVMEKALYEGVGLPVPGSGGGENDGKRGEDGPDV